MSYSGSWSQFSPATIPVRIERVEDRDTVVNVSGLIDTGATLSMITAEVAETLGLFPRHFRAIITANGQVELPFHVVRIVLQTEGRRPLRPRGVLEGRPSGFTGRMMLLGRDILQFGTLHMTRNRFTLNISSPVE